MAISKVTYAGHTLIDLTGDTVTPENLLSGTTAHAANGEEITGIVEDKKGELEAQIADLRSQISSLNADLSVQIVGSQIGSGSKTVSTDKRIIHCITKKSGVIVESKEIPTSVLESGDVVLLGNSSPVIYENTNTLDGQKFSGYNRNLVVGSQDFDASLFTYGEEGRTRFPVNDYFNLAADLSQSTGASITYNGSNSFTITVTDSTLSVYLCA